MNKEIENKIEEFLENFKKQRLYDYWHKERARDWIKEQLNTAFHSIADQSIKQERQRIIEMLEEEKQNLIFNVDISDRKIRNPNESKNHIEYNLLEKLKGKLKQ